jgi:hypothetical protein
MTKVMAHKCEGQADGLCRLELGISKLGIFVPLAGDSAQITLGRRQ